MHGGSGVVGSLFSLLPQAVVGGLVSGGVEGMVGVSMGIVMEIPSVWGGRDGRGTISHGCKYQNGIANTILGRVSLAATWKASMPGGG
jgi:hypothetical protein